MVTVEAEDHGSGAPREAVEEAGAIQTVRTILHHQEDSKMNNRHVPNVAQAEMDIPQHNAIVVASHATHENMLVNSVLTGEIDRTGAVGRNVWKTWYPCYDTFK